jgi:very-short-patch-repair endonuclease
MNNVENYNKKLKNFANENRKKMTKAEACLWKYVLKNSQTLGIQFRRQRPISRYIADFCSLELKFIIEVDGVTHDNPENQQKDKIRQIELEQLGYKVIRFQDNEVLKNIEGVRIVIRQEINKLFSVGGDVGLPTEVVK